MAARTKETTMVTKSRGDDDATGTIAPRGGGLIDELFEYLVPEPEVPPIAEFAHRADGLALPIPMYPRQVALAKLIFLEDLNEYEIDVISGWAENFHRESGDRIGVNPDIWDRYHDLRSRGYDHFHEIDFVGGRRAGKGFLGAVVMSRQMYRLIKMGSPQLYYGIDPARELSCFVTATTLPQAVRNQFADVREVVLRAPCFEPFSGVRDQPGARARHAGRPAPPAAAGLGSPQAHRLDPGPAPQLERPGLAWRRRVRRHLRRSGPHAGRRRRAPDDGGALRRAHPEPGPMPAPGEAALR
jgi:hypothetical protein